MFFFLLGLMENIIAPPELLALQFSTLILITTN
jgi:hypothetical protein